MIDAAPTRDLRLTRNVPLLVAARTARSVGQGVTVASFTLYLHALGYGGAAIGSVLMAGLSFGILLTLVVGPLSDRRGRRGLIATLRRIWQNHRRQPHLAAARRRL